MRIFAGIVLIIAAIINIVGGAGYVFGGAVTSAAGEAGAAVAKESKKSGAQDKKLEKASDKAKKTGGNWMVFGLFLWALMGMQIAAAVLLFMAKAKIYVVVVGALSILAEVIGISIVGFEFWQVFGLAGGVLAAAGAFMYKPKGAPVPAPA